MRRGGEREGLAGENRCSGLRRLFRMIRESFSLSLCVDMQFGKERESAIRDDF